MNKRRHSGPRLTPALNVRALDDRFEATSADPWLKLPDISTPRNGALAEIVYSSGSTDAVVRPVIRFISSDGAKSEALAAAASEGAGVWRGRVPRDTAEIWISPTTEPGPFEFRVESIRRLATGAAARAHAAAPKRAFFAASARMVRLHAEADLNLRWMLGRAEEQVFRAWRARRHRASVGPHACPEIVIVLEGAHDLASVRRTYRSLAAQTCSDWRLAIVAAGPEIEAWIAAVADDRVIARPSLDAVAPSADALVGLLSAGDRLAPTALAALAAVFERRQELALVYCDETHLTAGRRDRPVFKPEWSPTRQTFAPYVGRAALMRAALFAEVAAGRPASPEQAVDAALARLPVERVGHCARTLLECHSPVLEPARPQRPQPQQAQRPKVGIVIPTRDRALLLGACVNSAIDRTSYPDFELLIVDNDSAEKQTHDLFAQLQARDARVSVMAAPGPFNFSHLCNLGARRVAGEILLFLNNDTEVLQPDWIDKMLEFALAPDVGAVGAKLLYPSGRVQHAGVVLGMGGVAGHFGEGAREAEEGWLGWNAAPHEASAVTAACLMVERRKFEFVEGFDADNLPVDLNDVDLCLRLAERGWRTICDCRATLLHHQGASRGGGLRLQKVYAGERAYFAERWRAAIRQDPFFNPNLSLYDREPKLG